MDSLILYRDWQDTTGLNLSTYVDVAAGGINPGDASARSPLFLQGSVSAGMGPAFIGEARATRVFTVDLLLSAVSRDALHALFRGIEERLSGQSTVIAWTPDGASNPTWFRVMYGRLLGSERYDYHLERTRYARRLMELQCMPWGEGVRRTTATLEQQVYVPSITGADASGGLPSNPVVFPMPSVGGDRPAALRILWSTASTAGSSIPSAGGYQRWGYVSGFAWGLVPDAGFNPAAWGFGASTLRLNNPTLAGPSAMLTDPWIPGGAAAQFMGTTLASAAATKPWSSIAYAASFAGRGAPLGVYRVFAVARMRTNQDGWGRMWVTDGRRTSVATLFPSPSAFLPYDMGDFDTNGVVYPDWKVFFEKASTASFLASPAFNLAQLVMVPRSWGGGQAMYNSPTNPLAVGTGMCGIDGLEPELGARVIYPAYGSGGGPTTSPGSYLGWGQVPPVAAKSFTVGQQIAYRGDTPEAPYVPSQATAVPASHMQMVAYIMRAPGPGSNAGSGGYTQSDQDRPRVLLVTNPRYTFAR